MAIRFHKDGIRFVFSNKKKLVECIKLIGLVEQKEVGDINVIAVSDDRLLEINKRFLRHDFYTDIITFQFPAPAGIISGDLFISVARVGDNAKRLAVDFENEMSRVIIHGVLHLCGYGDKTSVEKRTMRKKEDFYLKSLKSM